MNWTRIEGDSVLTVIENVLSPSDAKAMLQQLIQDEWEDGKLSAGSTATQVKSNQQLKEGSALSTSLGNRILSRLGQHPQFLSAALPEKIYPPKFNRYADNGHYGLHVDGAIMYLPNNRDSMRTDLSVTLFLSDPEHYEGGELLIEGEFGAQSVKLNAGDLVLYPSSSLHQVSPVTSGERICSFFWIESLVRDQGERAMLYDIDQSVQSLTVQLGSQHSEVLRLSGIYHNLLRKWAKR